MNQPAITSKVSRSDGSVDTGASKVTLGVFERLLPGAGKSDDFTTILMACAYVVASAQLSKFLSQSRTVLPGYLFSSDAQRVGQQYFPDLVRAFKKIRADLKDTINNLWAALVELDKTGALDSPYLISDVYLAQKDKAPSSIKVAGDRLDKISGNEFFKRTQFFTEPYMADFLSEVATSLVRGESTAAAIIDPACGTGNLLISAFNTLCQTSNNARLSGNTSRDLIFNSIIGYDLDTTVSSIARASLTVAFARICGTLPKNPPNILVTDKPSQYGFFSPLVAEAIDRLVGHRQRILITNPPFLGRRLMDSELRLFLTQHYPDSRGDLCAAFILRCAEYLGDNDVLALVHQNTFWHLDSLASARSRLSKNMSLHLTVNLGSGAFRHLAGEKAAVSLSVLQSHLRTSVISRGHFDLSHHRLAVKATQLRLLLCSKLEDTNRAANDSTCFAKSFWKRASTRTSMRGMSQYAEWATPMQGTSTGNSAQAVKYSWEVPHDNEDWVSVSKGGGYCRWWGLNRYVVLWGQSGEKLKRFAGHALRNVNVINDTDLVFSDTGTQGLNVRVRLPGQVFIASGPGIRVQTGNELAHLAYLNSRVASLVLRNINPKLTIAAGYIKKLPFCEELAAHSLNARLAKKCVEAKQRLLARKITNDDCDLSLLLKRPFQAFDDYFRSELETDLTLELKKLEFESLIDENVIGALQLTRSQRSALNERIGRLPFDIRPAPFNIPTTALDQAVSAQLSLTCQYRSRSKDKRSYGCDGLLEALSQQLKAHPRIVFDQIMAKLPLLTRTKELYANDWLHKQVLAAMGFKKNREWRPSKITVRKVWERMLDAQPGLENALERSTISSSFRNWTDTVLPTLHAESFIGRPFLYVTENCICLTRDRMNHS